MTAGMFDDQSAAHDCKADSGCEDIASAIERRVAAAAAYHVATSALWTPPLPIVLRVCGECIRRYPSLSAHSHPPPLCVAEEAVVCPPEFSPAREVGAMRCQIRWRSTRESEGRASRRHDLPSEFGRCRFGIVALPLSPNWSVCIVSRSPKINMVRSGGELSGFPKEAPGSVATRPTITTLA